MKVVIMPEWAPREQTVNRHYYLQVLTTLGERVRRNRPELWENDSWISYQYDSLPESNARQDRSNTLSTGNI